MPPWNSLRLGRPSEKDLHGRHSADPGEAEPTTPTGPDDQVTPKPERNGVAAAAAAGAVSPRRNRKIRDSVVSLGILQPSQSAGQQPTAPPPDVPLLELPEGDAAPVRPHRFSLMRFRHASDSQLNKTAKEQSAAEPPPVPATPPNIIKTAPTAENMDVVSKRRSTFSLHRPRRGLVKKKSRESLHIDRDGQATPVPSNRVTFEGQQRSLGLSVQGAPPPYGDEHASLGVPVPRVSESSRSDASSNDHGIYAQTTTTTHTVSTTTTFFRIPRRRKDKGPLFPLPPKTESSLSSATNTPRMSSSRNSESPIRRSFAYTPESSGRPSGQHSPGPGRILRRSSSRTSAHSQGSSLRHPKMLGQRGRSSTKSSLRRPGAEEDSLPTPPLPRSTRTSTSTSGRPSLGGLFSMNRIKAGDSHLGRGARGDPGTPGSIGSKDFPIPPKEPQIVIPERQEGDTPAKYLARLEEVVNLGALVSVLSKSDDEFMKNVLRSYMRRFKFFEDPLDIAVRKLLMLVELPKETQQIDRTLQSFSDRYHECNPGIFLSADDAYFVSFSILLLHSDMFNKNNKHKMTKADYVRNARGQSNGPGTCAAEVLECFYDNTAYTTFIHLEDDAHFSSERIMAQKQPKKGALKVSSTPLKRGHSGPVDPYALILDNHLDTLRPSLEEYLVLEDSFNYLSPNGSFNIPELNKTFFRTGVIQILSARSRPEAFANQTTVMNPTDAQVGVVDIKVTKVGLLWRKDPKKKKTRSPWQEWGAVLTASQLYFFRNTSWVKNLMHQYENHQKAGRGSAPVVFKPPLEQFKPDFLISMDHAIALVDSRYKKHKHAFLFTRHDTFSEVFLADDEAERTDWLAKLNYAATYRTTGVRMRDITTSSGEGRKSTDSARDKSNKSVASGAEGEEPPSTDPADLTQEQQIQIARRQIIGHKLRESEERVASIEKSIESFLRTGRHIRLLTPIQTRTREEVVCAASHLSDILRFTRIEMWRFKCHRAILSLDLDDEYRTQTDSSLSVDGDSKSTAASPATVKEAKEGRLGFGRFNSKSGPSGSGSKLRPANLPTGAKLFSMDEIFRTPSRLRTAGNHKAKGSWELPPINFEAAGRRKSSSRTRTTKDGAADETAVTDSEADSVAVASKGSHSLRRASSEANLPSEANLSLETMDEGEAEALLQSGVLTPAIEHTAPSPTSPRFARSSKGESDAEKFEDAAPEYPGAELDLEDEARVADIDDVETRRKVRHSLQRKLQGQAGGSSGGHHHLHGGAHLRSHSHSHRRRNRDSGATITPGDEAAAGDGSETLPRTAGSFTVHGKKASVVRFSGDWSAMGLRRAGTDPAGTRLSLDAKGSRYSMDIGRAVTTGAAPPRPSADGGASVASGSDAGTATSPDPRSPVSFGPSEAERSFKSARSSIDDGERGRGRVSADVGEDEISPRDTRANAMAEAAEADGKAAEAE